MACRIAHITLSVSHISNACHGHWHTVKPYRGGWYGLKLLTVETLSYYVHVEAAAHGKPYQFGVKLIFACRLYRLALALQQGAQHGDVFFGVNLTERA